jgi:hypothetical protein
MVLMLALLLLGQSGPATPVVSEAHAEAVVKIGIATGSLAFNSVFASYACSPAEVSERGCERAKDDVQSARMKLQELTDPNVKPEKMNGCEKMLLAAAAHYSEDRLLAAGIASAQRFSAGLAAAFQQARAQLQVEPGPDAKLLSACRGVPGSWFAATWDAVVKAD